nr:DUF1561 family protein [Leptospira kirschneri]
MNIPISDIPEIYGRITSSTRIHTYGFARTMLPQYLWNLSNELNTPTKIRSHVNELFRNPAGSIWLTIVTAGSERKFNMARRSNSKDFSGVSGNTNKSN